MKLSEAQNPGWCDNCTRFVRELEDVTLTVTTGGSRVLTMCPTCKMAAPIAGWHARSEEEDGNWTEIGRPQ